MRVSLHNKSQKVSCWLDAPGHLQRAIPAQEGGLRAHHSWGHLSCQLVAHGVGAEGAWRVQVIPSNWSSEEGPSWGPGGGGKH